MFLCRFVGISMNRRRSMSSQYELNKQPHSCACEELEHVCDKLVLVQSRLAINIWVSRSETNCRRVRTCPRVSPSLKMGRLAAPT